MGGGESLPAQWERVAGVARAYVSANAHGAMLPNLGGLPGYIAHVDDPTAKSVLAQLSGFDLPMVSPRFQTQYRWPGRKAFGQSGHLAVELAVLLGAHPAIACGMDCGGRYWHGQGETGVTRGSRIHREKFEALRERLGGAQVRVVGGPLVGIWPKWDPGEVLPPYQPPAWVLELQAVHAVRVRFRLAKRVARHQFIRGQTAVLSAAEVAEARKIVEVIRG